MKRYVVLLLAGLWALSTPLAAQPVLGFHGGVNIANVAGDDVEDTEAHTGINVGASVLFSLGSNLGLQVGGFYSEKGAEIIDFDVGVDAKFVLSYIEFPVLFRYGFPMESAVGVHVFGGGAVALQSSCEVEASDGSVTVTVDCDEGGIDIKSTDFGLMGGAGVSFPVTERVDIMVDLLYNLGLVSVDDSGDDADIKNRALTIRAGVAIPLGG